MSTFQLEPVALDKVARVFRAGRKQLGLSQRGLASELQLSQSKLARIERGEYSPGVDVWSQFCSLTNIPDESVRSGFIERKTPLTESALILPGIYRDEANAKVRIARFFTHYIEQKIGPQALGKFLSDMNVDPDYFVDLDAEVNIPLVWGVVDTLLARGIITRASIGEMAQPASDAMFYGASAALLSGATTFPQLLATLTEHMTVFEVKPNFHYKVEELSGSHIVLSATMSDLFRSFMRRLDHPFWECDFIKKIYLAHAGLLRQINQKLILRELECVHFGGRRCVYRIDVIKMTQRKTESLIHL